jgi:hypothetical protein
VKRATISLRLHFDRRLTLQFHGSLVTSDDGLLAYRELADALGPSALASEKLADARTGKNGHHALMGMLRQAVFGWLAGYKDVIGTERLRHDPAMRWIIAARRPRGAQRQQAGWATWRRAGLPSKRTCPALTDLSAQWIDRVHARRRPKGLVLDMIPVSARLSEQEMSFWNGRYECARYHPLFVFNQFGNLEPRLNCLQT